MKDRIRRFLSVMIGILLIFEFSGVVYATESPTQETITRTEFISLMEQVSNESNVIIPDIIGGDEPLTREEAAFILQSMLHLPDATAQFEDVNPHAVYADAIGAVAEAGLMIGMSSQNFGYGIVLTQSHALYIEQNLKQYYQERQESYEPFQVASIQFNPELNNRDQNVEALYQQLEKAFQNGAKLAVAPEMSTTGYMYADREAIAPYVDTIPGKTTDKFAELTKKYDAYFVFGMPEVDPSTGLYYNAAALVGPEGYIGKYRKTHQWETEEHWAAWGDLGVPVFATEIGNIAINICMDSAYFESARLAALNGADILAFPTNSSAQAISALPARAMQNGLYIISANRSNTELGFHMIGASAVWSPEGDKLAEAPLIMDSSEDVSDTTIIMAEVDPAQYYNAGKELLKERRPELYKVLMLYTAPWDYTKSTESKNIAAMALQYEPVIGDKAANMEKVETLLESSIDDQSTDLVVLPELSLTGPVDLLAESPSAYAENAEGPTFQFMQELAIEYDTAIIYGFIENDGGLLYNSAILIGNDGDIEGKYRKTHLSSSDQMWATEGDQLSVFDSESLGKVGILIGEDAAFPEAAGVLAVNRADLIAIPSAWNGQFGGDMEINPNMSANVYPSGSMPIWDAVAIGAQSYTIVSNFVGTEDHFLGRSALYTLDPLYGLDQPVTASTDQEESLRVQFTTLQSDWWFNQEMLILSRRTDYYKPLVIESQ